jgi:cytochrome c oxidase subunit 2
VPVENEKMVFADDQYLRDSILLPNQHITAGYAAVMPSFQGVVPEGDLLDLISYLKELGTQKPSAALSPPL